MDNITKQSLEHLPPFDKDAEQALLGACFLKSDVVFELHEWMSPQDFYKPRHRKIYDAMRALKEQDSEVDLVLLHDQLHRHGTLDEIGGPAYLAELTDAVPTAANAKYHASVIHEKAVLRGILNAGIETVTRCYEDKTPSDTIIDTLSQKLVDLADGNSQDIVPASALFPPLYDIIDSRSQNPSILLGISSGYPDVDRMTSGFKPSELSIIAARPGVGKTALACNIALNMVNDERPVAFFSLEMSREELGFRLLSSYSGIDSQKFKTGESIDDDWGRLAQATEVLSRFPLFVDDTPSITPLQLLSKATRLKLSQNIQAVFVDYLQLMISGKQYGTREQEVTQMTRQLKLLAKKLSIPVIAVSQLNREIEKRTDKRPKLSDLRESGSIEQDADNIFFLYHDEEEAEAKTELIVSKQRSGPVGTIPLFFQKSTTTFLPYTAEYEAPEERIFK